MRSSEAIGALAVPIEQRSASERGEDLLRQFEMRLALAPAAGRIEVGTSMPKRLSECELVHRLFCAPY